MRRNLVRAIAIIGALLIMLVIGVVATLADDATETCTVTVYKANGDKTQTVIKKGTGFRLVVDNMSDKDLYGWYDVNGTLYNSHEPKIYEDTVFFEARGPLIKSVEDLKNSIKSGARYIRLEVNLTVNETLALPNEGLFTIDLNNYSLTMNTEGSAFTTYECSLNIVDTSNAKGGRLAHTGKYSNYDLMDSCLVLYRPMIFKSVDVRVLGGASVTTNVGFCEVANDISASSNTFNFYANGNLEASFLARTYGIKNAEFVMGKNAHVKVTGSQMFEDRGDYNGINMTFKMAEGTLDLARGTFVTNEMKKCNVFLSGGNYSVDLGNLYPNYSFKQNAQTKYYELQGCKHNDILIATTATCTEGGVSTYSCILCGTTHTDRVEKIGHSGYRVLTKEAVTTPTKTEKGEYTITCQRCGEKEIEYYYPLPNKAYVTLKILDDEGNAREIRVLSTSVFIFDKDNEVNSFTTTTVEAEYGVEKDDIISLELPLGATIVPSTLFARDSEAQFSGNEAYIREIYLPESVKSIKSGAFKNMPELEKIVGLEHVTEEIGESAFEQAPDSPLILDNLYVNAKNIGAKAFYNVTSTSVTFGKNASTIGDSAFGLDDGVLTQMKEIFIEGNEDESLNYSTLTRYNQFKSRFELLGTGHQFDSLTIVQVDHYSYIEGALDNDLYWKVHTPTCKEEGYTEYICRNCGASGITDIVDRADHNFESYSKVSTCQKQGFDGKKCTWCDEEVVDKYYDLDPNNHDYTYSQRNSHEEICLNDYHIIGICACGKEAPPAEWIWQEKLGGHEMDWNNPFDKKLPTCGEEGYYNFQCKHCSYTEKEILMPVGSHKLVADNKNSTPATCSQEGTMMMVCDVCGAVKPITTVIDKNNHTWERNEKGELVWITLTEATEERVGTEQNKCTGCGATQTRGTPIKTAKSNALTIALIVVGAVIVLGGVGTTLYFTVFRKAPSTSYKYKFNTLNKK